MALPYLQSASLAASGASDAEPAQQAQPGARSFEARLHRSLDGLEAIWRQFDADGAMTAYQRFDWVKCISDHLAPSAPSRPLYVEVFDPQTQRTLMILPLAEERRLGARLITWLNFNVCDYAAPICAADLAMSEQEAVLVWNAVRAVLPKADMIDIVQIPSDVGGSANFLALLPQSRRMALTASGVALGGDATTLISRLGGKSTEKELLKLRRRLDRRGTVRLVRAETAAEASAIFDALLDQRRQRFKKLGRFDLLANADIRAFYWQALLRSLGSGPAQLWGLAVDGEWIATSYNLIHGGIFHGLILTTGGEAWKNCSPGLVMVGELMVRYALDGQRYFDLTIGDLPYKAGFGAKPRELRRLLVHQTLHGLLVLRIMQAAAGSKTWLERHPRLFEAARRTRRKLRQMGDRSSPA